MSTLMLPAPGAAESLEFDVPCEVCSVPCEVCPDGAEWALAMERCGRVLLLCGHHRAVAAGRCAGSGWECPCGDRFPLGDSLTEHCVRVERI